MHGQCTREGGNFQNTLRGRWGRGGQLRENLAPPTQTVFPKGRGIREKISARSWWAPCAPPGAATGQSALWRAESWASRVQMQHAGERMRESMPIVLGYQPLTSGVGFFLGSTWGQAPRGSFRAGNPWLTESRVGRRAVLLLPGGEDQNEREA